MRVGVAPLLKPATVNKPSEGLGLGFTPFENNNVGIIRTASRVCKSALGTQNRFCVTKGVLLQREY